MATVLLDTDVVSFQIKGDTRAAACTPHLASNSLAVSFMTVAELFRWAAVHKWGTRRIEHLERALGNFLVVPVDIEMCRLWASVRAGRQSGGRHISAQDAWIAATALRHALPLVTHNMNDYQGVANLDIRTASLLRDSSQVEIHDHAAQLFRAGRSECSGRYASSRAIAVTFTPAGQPTPPARDWP